MQRSDASRRRPRKPAIWPNPHALHPSPWDEPRLTFPRHDRLRWPKAHHYSAGQDSPPKGGECGKAQSAKGPHHAKDAKAKILWLSGEANAVRKAGHNQ